MIGVEELEELLHANELAEAFVRGLAEVLFEETYVDAEGDRVFDRLGARRVGHGGRVCHVCHVCHVWWVRGVHTSRIAPAFSRVKGCHRSWMNEDETQADEGSATQGEKRGFDIADEGFDPSHLGAQ